MRLRRALILLSALLVLAGTMLPVGATPPIKIGVAYDVAGLGDMAFNDLTAEGAARAESDFGVKLFEKEMVKPSGKTVDGFTILDKLAKKTELVVAVGFLYGDGAVPAAEANPDTNFAVIDSATDPMPPNLLGAFTADHEGSFLVGAAAAMESDAHRVGFLGGIEFAPITRFEAGFAAGARHVDDSVSVAAEYLGTFTDQVVGYEMAMDMYESGVDVVFAAAGAASYGVYAAAADFSNSAGTHVWAIGVDFDVYPVVVDEIKPHILTSMLKRIDIATYDIIESQVLGTFTGGYAEWGVEAGGVDYATSGGFVDGYVGDLETIKAGIIAGDIVVPTEP